MHSVSIRAYAASDMTNLERMRRERDWRQSDLAEKSGAPQSSISRAENGGSISVVNAVRIARALETTVETLFGEEQVTARDTDDAAEAP